MQNKPPRQINFDFSQSQSSMACQHLCFMRCALLSIARLSLYVKPLLQASKTG